MFKNKQTEKTTTNNKKKKKTIIIRMRAGMLEYYNS